MVFDLSKYQGGICFAPKLIWENASLTSNFAAQTIEMDLSEYNWFIIITKFSVDYTNYFPTIIPKDGASHMLCILASSSNRIGTRSCSVTDTGFNINGAKYNASENDKYVLPAKIYGLRGVST